MNRNGYLEHLSIITIEHHSGFLALYVGVAIKRFPLMVYLIVLNNCFYSENEDHQLDNAFYVNDPQI